MRTHRTMIVPAALVETVRSLAATWPEGGGMFTTPLAPPAPEPVYSDDPLEPYVPPEPPTPTHYISTGLIDANVAEVMPWVEYTTDEETGEPLVVQHDGNPELLAQMLHAQHPEASVEQLQSIIAACDISEQEPNVAIARLGLKVLTQ